MRTRTPNVSRPGSLLAPALIAAVIVLAAPVLAERDHLKGYRVKDRNAVAPPASSYLVDSQFGSDSCQLKKLTFFLVQSEKNGGDDPRSGPAGNFVCYKAKCTGPRPPLTAGDSQFGVHSLEISKPRIVCLPFNEHLCGDATLDPGEECDGIAGACPGSCQADCTCPPQVCNNNVREGTEVCDGSDAAACPGNCTAQCYCAQCDRGDGSPQACGGALDSICGPCCAANPNCQAACAAAASCCGAVGCISPTLNDACAAAVDAAGCANECGCPTLP